MIARTEKEFIKPITIKELVLFTYQLKIGLFSSENTMFSSVCSVCSVLNSLFGKVWLYQLFEPVLRNLAAQTSIFSLYPQHLQKQRTHLLQQFLIWLLSFYQPFNAFDLTRIRRGDLQSYRLFSYLSRIAVVARYFDVPMYEEDFQFENIEETQIQVPNNVCSSLPPK